MKWLLWKDYRNNRVVVIAALAFLLVPHLSALVVCCLQRYYWDNNDPWLWTDSFISSTICSLIVSQLAVGVIAGNVIAGERADRSAEFLVALPIPRKRILASKLLLALAVIAVIWLTDGSALLFLKGMCFLEGMGRWGGQVWPILGYTAITAFLLFSVAWCLSSFLASPTYSVAAGLFTPVLLWLSIIFAAFLVKLDIDNEQFERIAEFSYCGICLALAPVCFTVGTWYYLRRVEP
jgi:ABC-type transport system involved in multi-copper enzyme maturation permease subunit